MKGLYHAMLRVYFLVSDGSDSPFKIQLKRPKPDRAKSFKVAYIILENKMFSL